MNQISSGDNFPGGTDAVVGVSAHQNEDVEDWSEDLFPRAATSNPQSKGGHGYGSNKKSWNSASFNSSGSSGVSPFSACGGQSGKSPPPVSKDDAERYRTTTVDDSRSDRLAMETHLSRCDGEWTDEVNMEGEVKGRGDVIKLTLPMKGNVVIGM